MSFGLADLEFFEHEMALTTAKFEGAHGYRALLIGEQFISDFIFKDDEFSMSPGPMVSGI